MVDTAFIRHGRIFGVEIASIRNDGDYALLVSPDTATGVLLARAASASESVPAAETINNQPWLRIPYTRELDDLIVATVDAMADLRYHRPFHCQVRMNL